MGERDSTITGAKADRASLADALQFMRAGDTLVVWKLDRRGRSLWHLINTVRRLQKEGKEFQRIIEHIDTRMPGEIGISHLWSFGEV